MVKLDKNQINRIIWILIAIVFVAGLYLRFKDLVADPPMYFDGHAQSLSTDPHQYTYFARNKLLFDEAEIFDSARWGVFEVSLVSAFSYLVFSILGISRFTSNLTGLLLSLFSILLFLWTIRKIVNHKGILLTLFLLMFNQVLQVYGRLPYLENGMIFLMTVVFFVFVEHRQNFWGQILLGVLVALTGLAGKIFGFLFIIPVVFSYWYENRQTWLRNCGIVVASCLGTSVIWILLAYGGKLSLILSYYQSQTLGLHGFPDALKSPFTFFEHLISFGNDPRLYYRAPATGVAGFFALLLILYKFSRDRVKENMPILFLIVWFIAGQLLLMPENYRPLRYIYMLCFPLAGLAGFALTESGSAKEKLSAKNGYLYYGALFLLFWVFIEQIAFNIFWDNHFERLHARLVWFSAPIAIAIVYAEMKSGFLKILTSKYFRPASAALVVILALWSFGQGYFIWQKEKSFNIKEAGDDIGQVLSQDAVVCGPIAPDLLLENKLKGMLYAVGVSDNDNELFRKYPITHFAIDVNAAGAILSKFPELKPALTVGEYWIRDVKVVVVGISHLTGNKDAALYKPTDFEIGRKFMAAKVFDSSVYYFERFASIYPDNKSVMIALGVVYPMVGRMKDAIDILNRAVELYPFDFSLLKALGTCYQMNYISTGNQIFKTLALRTYTKAVSMEPYQGDEIMTTIRRLSELMRDST